VHRFFLCQSAVSIERVAISSQACYAVYSHLLNFQVRPLVLTPQVFSLLKQNATSAVIADHLTSIARDQMGLSISDASLKHATETADVLVDYKEWIAEKFEQSTPPNPHSPSAQGPDGR
jgi:hypothetical protein